jgi:hypothetical protein
MTEIDEKEFQQALCIYLKNKLPNHAKEVQSISAAFGVNTASTCNFKVESILKKMHS